MQLLASLLGGGGGGRCLHGSLLLLRPAVVQPDGLAGALHGQEDGRVDGDGAVHGRAEAAPQPLLALHRHALLVAVQGGLVLGLRQVVALHLGLDGVDGEHGAPQAKARHHARRHHLAVRQVGLGLAWCQRGDGGLVAVEEPRVALHVAHDGGGEAAVQAADAVLGHDLARAVHRAAVHLQPLGGGATQLLGQLHAALQLHLGADVLGGAGHEGAS
mmetsp:Transcript_13990/g.34476  ORF Transcript_13990/g.34476 Transcript_13990/m.34476 type:complete len:216 (-) Transcript_13990:626-1273(-)